MLVERYLSNNENIGIDTNGFLIGNIGKIDDETGTSYFDYTLSGYSKIDDIIQNPFSIIIGNGGLGKSTLLKQIEQKLKKYNYKFYRLNLCSLTTETDLLNNIKDNLKNISKDEKIYILLDAVDEALDNNIRNPIELISQTINKILNEYKQSKFIITSRTQVYNINNLAEQLYEHYKIDKDNDNFVYQLCPLTQKDAQLLAKYMGITDTNKFIQDINNLSLSHFLTSPITFKSIVDLYKLNKINENTNHYEIFLHLMKTLCMESSEYRKQQAIDGIGKFKNYTSDELLITAGKLAVELKIKKKSYISLLENNSDYSICINDFFNITISDKFGKKYKLDKDLLYFILNSKLFYKNNNQYLFCQKTYFDFLCAYYLININFNICKFNKLFLCKGRVNPGYYDILSLFTICDEKFFNYYLKKSPESLIFSNIIFNNDIYNRKLFEKYIGIIKEYAYPDRNTKSYFICKKLYFKNSKKYIQKLLQSNNEEIVTIAIKYIYINKLTDYGRELKNIIFDNNSSCSNKQYAIEILNEHTEYKYIIDELYNKIDDFINSDTSNKLRACLLETFYPKYISDTKLLSYIVPIKENYSFDYYQSYIRHEFLNNKYINKNNVLLYLKWVFNNELIGITRELSSPNYFNDNVKRFFVKAADFIENKEIIDEIINYQVKIYPKIYQCFSKFLFDKISENKKLRLYALKTYIKNSINDKDLWIIKDIKLFTSKDTAYIMALYKNEKYDENKNKYEKFINNYAFCNYWDNREYKDFEYIQNVFKSYPDLKETFKQFNILSCAINNKTGEPIDEYSIESKKFYIEQLKSEENRKEFRQEKDNKIEYYSDTQERIKECINDYYKTKDAYNLIKIFSFLKYRNEQTELQYEICLDFTNTKNWKKLNKNSQDSVINACIDYLKKNEEFRLKDTIEQCVIQGKSLIIWNCLGALKKLKDNGNTEEYISLLIKHKIAVFYYNAFDENDKLLQKEFLCDLYKYEKEFIKDQIDNILMINSEFTSHYTDIFFNFEYVMNDFICLLSKCYENKKQIISENAKIAVINFFISQNQNLYIEKCLQELKKNIKNDKFIENNILISNLDLLLKYFKQDYWVFIKNVFYKNKKGVEIFIKVAKYFDFQSREENFSYKNFNNKELSEFYIWLNKNIPSNNYYGVHEYKPEEHASSRLYNYILNTGNYKCIQKIKCTMTLDVYKRSYYIALYQYL